MITKEMIKQIITCEESEIPKNLSKIYPVDFANKRVAPNIFSLDTSTNTLYIVGEI